MRLFPEPRENGAVFARLSHNLSGTAIATILGGMETSALNTGDAVPMAEMFRKPVGEETIRSRVAGSKRGSLWARKSLKRREGLKEIDISASFISLYREAHGQGAGKVTRDGFKAVGFYSPYRSRTRDPGARMAHPSRWDTNILKEETER